MTASRQPLPATRRPLRIAAAIFAASAGTLAVALAFQHIGGYVPCPLCLTQRAAYYAALPLAAAAFAASRSGRARIAALLFLLTALAFLGNSGLGIYQAGAEWKFWPGPSSCEAAQPLATAAKNLLKELETARAVRCDEASWRFAGLSFAGWNGAISLVLAGLGLWGARAVWKCRR